MPGAWHTAFAALGSREQERARYWLLHLWIKAHLPLQLPLHLAKNLTGTQISLTYTHDLGTAVPEACRIRYFTDGQDRWTSVGVGDGWRTGHV